MPDGAEKLELSHNKESVSVLVHIFICTHPTMRDKEKKIDMGVGILVKQRKIPIEYPLFVLGNAFEVFNGKGTYDLRSLLTFDQR